MYIYLYIYVVQIVQSETWNRSQERKSAWHRPALEDLQGCSLLLMRDEYWRINIFIERGRVHDIVDGKSCHMRACGVSMYSYMYIHVDIFVCTMYIHMNMVLRNIYLSRVNHFLLYRLC